MASTSSIPELTLSKIALLNGPAGTPPPGVLPIFENSSSLNTAAYTSGAVCIIFASLAILIRIYTRRVLLHSVGYDDYASVVSWLCLICYVVACVLSMKAGVGIHIWNLQLRRFIKVLYWVHINVILYNPTVFFVKVSILLQYSRIFVPTMEGNLPMVLAIRVGICTILVFYMIAMFFDIFQCTPLEKSSNPLVLGGYCYNIYALGKVSGVFNVASDFAILILPMSSVWRLYMSLRKKILTSAVFAVGFLACATSIMRTYYAWKIASSSDKSYLFLPFGLWSLAELTAGIVVGCFPAMPRFFQHVGPRTYRILSFRSRLTNPSGYNQGARTAPPRTDAFIKIKSPSDNYNIDRSLGESDHNPEAQLRGENYMLDELQGPQTQAGMAQGVGIPTRRDDLEHGLPGPEVLGTPINAKRQTI